MTVIPDAVAEGPARVFVGETLKLTATTGLSGSVDKAISVSTRMPGVDPFKDTRVIAGRGLASRRRSSRSPKQSTR